MTLRRKQIVLQPAGVDGAAVATAQFTAGRAGALRFIKIDYGAGVPATTDILIKRDTSAGATVLTRTSSLTDIGPVAVGTVAIDEGRAATAATDALSGGIPFTSGLYIDVAEADNYAADEDITIDLYWEPLRKANLSITTTNAGAGTSAGNVQWTKGRPGVLRFLQADFGAVSATADFTIKRDDSSGATVFTSANSATDFGPSAVGTAGADEAFAASAATDGLDGGLVFNTGLYLALAQSDALITSTFGLWYEA